MSIFYQAGTVTAFLSGVYNGDVPFKTLSHYGDFGLGTFNGVDGELIAVDGVFYRVDAKGIASIVSPELCTPFAVLNQFQKVEPLILEGNFDLKTLSDALDKHLTTTNIFYMMRIDCELEWIKLRSESCQPRPYRPLTETLPLLQTLFELNQTRGTLVVSRCPDYSASVTIPGFHYHYINDERTTGGHVFDFKLRRATVMINPLRQFNMILFNNKEFDQCQLDMKLLSGLKEIE